jgi:hypothetical protein
MGIVAKKRVPMPRFRGPRARVGKMSLTKAVMRVLHRSSQTTSPFAVLIVDDTIVLSRLNTSTFEDFQLRYPESIVGIYGPDVRVADITSDLSDHFTDEADSGVTE